MKNGSFILVLAALIAAAFTLGGCVTMSAPPPLATFGGPETVPAGQSEAGLAVGTGFSLFPSGHDGGDAWFGRWRQGLGDRFDLGLDVMGLRYSDKGSLTLKLAGRYGLDPHWRLEAGIGTADDSNGRSLNAELGITLGTVGAEKPWNYYTSLRFAGAHGFPGGFFGSGDSAPPDDAMVLGAIGASGRISDNERFIIEGGYGLSVVDGQGGNNPGQLVYLGTGLQFFIGKNP